MSFIKCTYLLHMLQHGFFFRILKPWISGTHLLRNLILWIFEMCFFFRKVFLELWISGQGAGSGLHVFLVGTQEYWKSDFWIIFTGLGLHVFLVSTQEYWKSDFRIRFHNSISFSKTGLSLRKSKILTFSIISLIFQDRFEWTQDGNYFHNIEWKSLHLQK